MTQNFVYDCNDSGLLSQEEVDYVYNKNMKTKTNIFLFPFHTIEKL